jgi:hypothetical protein
LEAVTKGTIGLLKNAARLLVLSSSHLPFALREAAIQLIYRPFRAEGQAK